MIMSVPSPSVRRALTHFVSCQGQVGLGRPVILHQHRLSSTLTIGAEATHPSDPSSSSSCIAESSNDSVQQRPKVVFSGIQPTGIPHLGNYLGALRNWVDLQTSSAQNDQLIFSIVGYHALTLPQDPKRLFQERRDMMATLLAIGLDPDRCILYHQDQVPQHTELAWFLNCLLPFGKLTRMTTWKSKIATSRNVSEDTNVDESHLSLGLFSYPVLQAADILLYKATHVPVGEDQVQHLELSRDVADLFNRRFKKRFFPLPQHMITPAKRILSLRDPFSKMSKSAPDLNSRILITDTPQQISSKIRKAVTDSESALSYDPINRPGISNLLLILSCLEKTRQQNPNLDPITFVTSGGSSIEWLKKTVTESIVETLRPIQKELEKVKQDPGYLEQVEEKGKSKAQSIAESNMRQVRRFLGIAP